MVKFQCDGKFQKTFSASDFFGARFCRYLSFFANFYDLRYVRAILSYKTSVCKFQIVSFRKIFIMKNRKKNFDGKF